MKNRIAPLMGVAVLVGVLVACSSTVSETIDASAHEAELQAFETLSSAAQRATYQKMTSGERAALWDAHLGRLLRSGELNADQAAVVEEIRTHLEDAMGPSAAQMEARLRKVMNADEVRRTVETLGNPSKAKRAVTNPNGIAPAFYAEPIEEGNNCTDRWANSYECRKMQMNQYPCYKQDCTTGCVATTAGCGWFLLQSCNEKCSKSTCTCPY